MDRPRGQDLPADLSGLPAVEELSPLMRFRKGTVLGNMLAALYRMRRVPAGAIAAARAAKADPPPPRSTEERRDYRAVYVIPAGPREWEPLRDTIESVLAYEGEDAKVVVLDDASSDCRPAIVKARFPAVDVFSRRVPSGGPPRNLPSLMAGFCHALESYSFEVLMKIDTDALVTGSSPSAAAAEYFRRQPEVGLAGTYLLRTDGIAEDYEWDHWVLPHTERWSPSARAMMRRARAGGYQGSKVHGGVYAVSRPALEAIAASGDIGWRGPWWTPLGEDFWASMLALANGFQLGSLGGPGEPFAVASKYTPIAKERVLAEGKLAIHSIRRGVDGEDEEKMRAFFRAEREGSHAGSVSAAETDSSRPPGR